ncbi:MAG: type II secretion system protein GspH [Gammaproteobacteria bacterium]|nr:MAG: type II secretion system protein GspH [Gammaproteobacteria bacterium]RKZ75927.1 MAG: type II secretion system protein GspH [Gammaproteobacteria bacterium]
MLHLFFKVKGFTLIEIMVVMIIISVILTFMTLSIGDGGLAQKLKQEAQRFASLLTMASQEAIMQSKEMGVSFEIDGYHFYVLQEQQWQASQDEIFRPRRLPPGIESELYLEGESIVLNNMEKNAPQLLLLSSGELTPFKVIFKYESEGLHYQLIGTATGKMSLQQYESF